MDPAPRLVDVAVPEAPDGVVLVLHGGASRGAGVPVRPTQLSVVRMVPVARRVAGAGRGRLAVLRLLNSVRGWDEARTPVEDVAWALERCAERFGPLGTCLVGHSLGGRAALLSAGRPEVRSVCALAPWVYPDDRVPGLSGRERILVVHGDADRVARIDRARAMARSLAREADVAFLTVSGGKHAMLARRSLFDGAAATWAAHTLLGDALRAPLEPIAAGERDLVA